MLSYTIPFLAELSDSACTPISAYLMTRLYTGNLVRIVGVVSFFEEAEPLTDVLPTFTIIWFDSYVLYKNDAV